MATQFGPARTLVSTPTSTVTALPLDSSNFDERWEAWQAKGAAQDRAMRRTLAIFAPLVAIVAAAIFYALSIR